MCVLYRERLQIRANLIDQSFSTVKEERNRAKNKVGIIFVLELVQCCKLFIQYTLTTQKEKNEERSSIKILIEIKEKKNYKRSLQKISYLAKERR